MTHLFVWGRKWIIKLNYIVTFCLFFYCVWFWERCLGGEVILEKENTSNKILYWQIKSINIASITLLPLWNIQETVVGTTIAQTETQLSENTFKSVDIQSYSPQLLRNARNLQTLTVYQGMSLKHHVSNDTLLKQNKNIKIYICLLIEIDWILDFL